MNGWGGKMLAAADTVARLAAVGFGLPEDALVSRLVMGPHLLAPTGAFDQPFSRTLLSIMLENPSEYWVFVM